ncbi:MAG: hypothetical protein JNM63_09285 [Spirochaetia bacterium]|nr:hypothetical protein [Spirochaetia bacterium]
MKFIPAFFRTSLFLALGAFLGAAPVSPSIDEAVRKLPSASSPEEVASQLGKLAKTDWEKTRALYVWMAENVAYDTDSYFSKVYPDQKPDAVFKSKKGVCAGYAGLFSSIGKKLGLEVTTVPGTCKGYSFATTGKTAGHDWNAVMLEGPKGKSWHLFDSTWGAGYVGTDKTFHKFFTDYWFDVAPEQMAFSHFPTDAKWLLFEEGLSPDDCKALPDLATKLKMLSEMGFKIPGSVKAISAMTFPNAYAFTELGFRIADAPLAETLTAGKEVAFAFTVRGVEKAALINNKEWHYFEKSGERFSQTLAPKPGTLTLNIQCSRNGTNSFWRALSYTVK